LPDPLQQNDFRKDVGFHARLEMLPSQAKPNYDYPSVSTVVQKP
jgi:hypothetical protein